MARSARSDRPPARPSPSAATYTIHIGGKEFPVTIERVKVSTLKIDLKNPRLHSELGLKASNGGVTTKQVVKAIWEQNDTKELFNQILIDGGLIEPLFVRQNDVIAEGNRRWVCIDKILHDEDVAELNSITDEQRKQFESIDIFRIPADATEKDILTMLLDWHVSAKKAWSKPDQTEILWRLRQGGMDDEELSRRTRQPPGSIRNRLAAYELLQRFREKSPQSTPALQSNLLTHYRQLTGNKVLREWIAQDDGNFDLFNSWVRLNKIEEPKDTRDRLPKIVEDPKALAALVGDDDVKVKEVFIDFSKGSRLLFDLVAECSRALQNAPYREVTNFSTNKAKERKLRKLEMAIAAFRANVDEATGDRRGAARAAADD
jgi:hypothetical protein